ncbi:hypothetical protein AXX17_ATUG04590 [Arabidopsis thaliana]|uniref:FAD:protein FMN transferase n=1 Tax=Arabidopsis thaliana TaxID=3702 RepID=A0A178U5C4_ARATH|nr:hypothetical protein AXX17_ATUG04590 [Arabidopsis thaliana]
MNTEIVTWGLPPSSQAKAESWFAFVEHNLSRFLPTSELSKLNNAQGRPFMASALLYQVLSEADLYREATGGIFSPYLGSELIRLGYRNSFEQLSADVSVENDLARQAPSMRSQSTNRFPVGDHMSSQAHLNSVHRSITLQADVTVDLGGFAKGWATQQLAGMLKREGIRALAIGAGGDLLLWGTPAGGWEIMIASPFSPADSLMSLVLRGPAGIATSSIGKRRWKGASGAEHHHLVDPRTGLSADTDLVQVTLIAPSAILAEVCAKCVLILGPELGPLWLEEQYPSCAVIGVMRDGSLVHAVTRAAGLTSYLLLFVSTAAGLGLSSKSAKGRLKAPLLAIHQAGGWFGFLFGALHGTVLLFDRYIGYSASELLLPFTSRHEPVLTGLGTLAFYITLILMLSSDLMKQLGRKTWRVIHFLAFPGYVMGLIHGLLLGSDSHYPWARIMYLLTGGVITVLTVHRVASARNGKSNSKTKTPQRISA